MVKNKERREHFIWSVDTSRKDSLQNMNQIIVFKFIKAKLNAVFVWKQYMINTLPLEAILNLEGDRRKLGQMTVSNFCSTTSLITLACSVEREKSGF